MNPLLTIKHLKKSFEQGAVKAVDNTSLQLNAGKTYAFLGESGSGKTTLARLIAGLERPDEGEIYLDEKLIESPTVHLPAEKREIGFVFQHYALFPHLTVAKNIAYGISKDSNQQARVEEMLDLVDLAGYASRYPHEISGGQQQRVALARALAPKPKLLILDEPFSNLDTNLRTELRTQIFDILKGTGVCAIFITHNSEDAMAIADEILVLKDGQLLQQANPKHLYENPKSAYIARFFDSLVELTPKLLSCFNYKTQEHKRYYLRTHHFRLEESQGHRAEATLVKTTHLGKTHLITAKVDGVTFEFSADSVPDKEEFMIYWSSEDLLIFDRLA